MVAGDRLLIPTQGAGPLAQHSNLHALNLTDGSPRWQRHFEYALVTGLSQLPESLKLSGSLILIATSSTDLLRGEGALLALDAAGEEHWRWAPGVQRVSAPAIAGGTVCASADARTLFVIDLATGEERTRVPLENSASLAAPAVVGDIAYVPCRGPRLLAVGLDGQMHWRFDAKESSNAWLDYTPVIVGDRLFTVLSSGAVLALHIKVGSLAWQTRVGPEGKRLSPPAADGERLYVGARDGLYALNLGNGSQVWSFPTLRRVQGAPALVGGVVYFTCHDHLLYALDAATGQEMWRYQVERRIEVSPCVANLSQACVFIADRGGTLTAIGRPLSAAEHEAEGHWVEAASTYAALSQFTRGADLLETHAEPFKAAELWKAAGERERAATQYEVAGVWQRAVELWEGLGRMLKRAKALEGYARSLADGSHTEEERAEAWAVTAQAFEAAGDTERVAICQREVARHLRQPIIAVSVKHEGLVFEAWSRLRFIVRNEGYGPARNLTIRASVDQFEGQVTATRQITTLQAGSERIDWLDVHPRAYGDSVPLRVSLECVDHADEVRSYQQTIYIPVARIPADRGAAQVYHIDSGGGAVVVGDVTTESGDFIGRDRPTGVDQRGQEVHGPQINIAEGAADTELDITPSPEASRLHRIISSRLDLEEFRTLCFHLGVNYDNLGGEGLAGKARQLVLHLQKRDALPLLVEWLKRERPDIEV